MIFFVCHVHETITPVSDVGDDVLPVAEQQARRQTDRCQDSLAVRLGSLHVGDGAQ